MDSDLISFQARLTERLSSPSPNEDPSSSAPVHTVAVGLQSFPVGTHIGRPRRSTRRVRVSLGCQLERGAIRRGPSTVRDWRETWGMEGTLMMHMPSVTR